jgi:ribosome-interacting GTPase 1
MAANLSPEFKKAQEAYRKAHEPKERLECLREMLRTIPKHKGTEHIQADLRTRVKELTEELTAPRKGVARGGPPVAIHPEGAAQIALLGPPNAGKSSLHARLTGSRAATGPYPFTTKFPLPGMLPHEDVQFQLVDLPPVSTGFAEPWIGNALQRADAALLVVDLAAVDCMDAPAAIRSRLHENRVHLVDPGEIGAPPPEDEEGEIGDPFAVRLPTVILANKCDLFANPEAEVDAFRQLAGVTKPVLAVSAGTGHGLGAIGPLLFGMLGIVRVYGKAPGHPPDRSRPFTLRPGATVRDFALLVHRGFAAELKFARLWGSGRFEGEPVSGEHPVRDGDIVELHW